MCFSLKNGSVFLSILFILCKISVFGQLDYVPATNYGGKYSLQDLIDKELVYPDSSFKNEYEGTVYFKFIINEYGKPEKLSILEGVNKEIDKEAVRIFNKILWLPAREEGSATSSVETLEIKFNIREHKKRMRARRYKKLPYGPFKIDTSFAVYSLDSLEVKPKPHLPNGQTDIQKYISAVVKYPQDAIRSNISGTTRIQYIIEPYGGITNIRIIDKLGGGCSLSVAALLKNIKCSPGIYNGMAVRTVQEISIAFILPNNSDYKVIDGGNYGTVK